MKRPAAGLADVAGIGAIEFALVTPILLLLLLGAFDLGRLVYASARTQAVADQIAQMLAETPQSAQAATSGDGLVSSSDVLTLYNAAPFIYPDVLLQAQQQGVAWSSLLKLDMASVAFTPTPTGCTTSCAYKPKIVWNYGDATYLRACGTTLAAAADTAVSNPLTLPTDAFGPNSLLVVDVHLVWTPTIGAAYLSPVTLTRSIFLNPRYVNNVEASAGNGVNLCP